MTDTPALLLLGLRFLLAASLYAFLGGILALIWFEFRQANTSAARNRIPPITLTTKSPNAPARNMTFVQPAFIIGRDPASGFPLELDTVSTQHARLYYQNEQWWLEDLGSRNGTFLNEHPVTIPVVLTDQDQIRCGEATLTLQIDASLPGDRA